MRTNFTYFLHFYTQFNRGIFVEWFWKFSRHIYFWTMRAWKDVVSARRKWLISPPFFNALTSSTYQKVDQMDNKIYPHMDSWLSSPHLFLNHGYCAEKVGSGCCRGLFGPFPLIFPSKICSSLQFPSNSPILPLFSLPLQRPLQKNSFFGIISPIWVSLQAIPLLPSFKDPCKSSYFLALISPIYGPIRLPLQRSLQKSFFDTPHHSPFKDPCKILFLNLVYDKESVIYLQDWWL